MTPTYYIKNGHRYREADPQPLSADHEFIEDCLWMSYRYCVGRHTIASHMHAGDMVEFLRANFDIVTLERRAFMGRDIKGEINHHMHFMRNVNVRGSQEHHDAITLVLAGCIQRGIKPSEFFSWRFDVDCVRGICEVTPNDEPKREVDSLMDIEDMMAWLKVANYLDPTERITYSYQRRKTTTEGFSFYGIDRSADSFKCYHVNCEAYAQDPHDIKYLAPEYIVKIEMI